MDFGIGLVVREDYIGGVLVGCNMEGYSGLLGEVDG